ncbi:MAG: CinA family nicotinamide mononucleotide deamidase-related protein, partial [Acetatifactor sp.]|nr:CinA family nicotinamide mononucleotide deamidase-related protein [Acetatifactor sp.]
MTVELICVGTELLLGNIVNTNAAYLAEKCAGLGLSCYYQSVVGDNEQRLKETLRTAIGRSDVVILSGGLGPTEDDLTKEAAADVMGRELMEDAVSRAHIEAYFADRGLKPTENNWKQALMPEGGIVLHNPNGTAPGVIIAGENTHVVLLPGPPHELMPMFENHVIPYLKRLEPGIIVSQTVKICGIGESRVETLLKDLIDRQDNPTLATYAKPGEVHIRVTAKAEGEK